MRNTEPKPNTKRRQLKQEHEAEKAKLSEEKDRLTAEVQPYRAEGRHGRDRQHRQGVAVRLCSGKEENLAELREQAKSYTANRDEIETLRERSAAVSQREQRADRRAAARWQGNRAGKTTTTASADVPETAQS